MNSRGTLHFMLAETFSFLDSSDIHAVERVKKFIQKSLNQDGDPGMLYGLMTFQLATQSNSALSLLREIREPLDKDFFDRIYEFLRYDTTRDLGMCLLNDIISSSPRWTSKILDHRLFPTLFSLLEGGNITFLACCLTAFTTLLSTIPFQAGEYLNKFFYAFSYAASFATRDYENTAEDIAYFKDFLVIYFNRLYAMYPSNFLAYLQNLYGLEGKESNSQIYLETVKPMVEKHRLHPLLITECKDSELSCSRWENVSPCDILTMSVNLAVGESDSKTISLPIRQIHFDENSDQPVEDDSELTEVMAKTVDNLKYISQCQPLGELSIVSSTLTSTSLEIPRNMLLHQIPTVLGSTNSHTSAREENFNYCPASLTESNEALESADSLHNSPNGHYLNDEITILRQDIDSLHYQLQFERHRIMLQEGLNKSLLEEAEKSQIQTQKDLSLVAELDLIKIENEHLKISFKQQEAAFHKMKLEKEEIERKLNDERVVFRSQINSLNDDNKQLTDFLSSEQTLVKEMKNEQESIRAVIYNLEHKNKEQEIEILQLRNSVTEIDSLRRSNAALQEFVHHFRESSKPKQSQELPIFKQEVTNADTGSVPYNNLLDGMTSHVENLEAELFSAQNKIIDLSKTFEILNETHANNIMARDDRLADMQKALNFNMTHILQLYQVLEKEKIDEPTGNSTEETSEIFFPNVPEILAPISSFEKFFTDVNEDGKKSNGFDFSTEEL